MVALAWGARGLRSAAWKIEFRAAELELWQVGSGLAEGEPTERPARDLERVGLPIWP